MTIFGTFFENVTLRKIVVVTLSISAFVFSLTQVAYVELTGARYNGVDETAANNAMSLFLLGWRAFPWVMGIGVVLALPFLVIPFVVHGFIEWRIGRSLPVRRWVLAFFVLIVAALWISGLLAVLSWFANPLMLVVWLFFLFGSRNRTFVAALMATILMVSYLNVAPLPIGWKDSPIIIQSYAVGYWAWVASAAIMVIASFPYQAAMQFYRKLRIANP